MKKIFTLFALFAMSGCLFVSCSTTNEDSLQNPLVGTMWVEDDDIDSYPVHVEFTGENTVAMWCDGFMSERIFPTCIGTYTIQGNDIKFSVQGKNDYEQFIIDRGVFTYNTLRIYYHVKYNSSGNMSERTLILYKK